ncbi:MAG: DHH family phosphoesterase [Phycisphaeraceae bacterium]
MLEHGLQNRWRPATVPATPATHQSEPRDPKSEILTRLLANRGITDPAAIERFLNPSLNDLTDPAAIPGVDRAARRLAQAVADRQPIVIYGDYDVDGVTASAVLWHTLRAAGADPAIYIPHRVDEGYGLNPEAIRAIAAGEAGDALAVPPMVATGGGATPLIITVDCGITAVESAQVARELGVDLIITDHHHFDADALPAAHTLVHPGIGGRGQRADSSEEPSTETPSPTAPCSLPPADSALCGAGVAFKLAWHFARVHTASERLPAVFRDLLVNMLSLVALGTVADVVPLTGENRVLTTFGLRRVKHTPLIGLAALIDAANLRDENIDAYHVGFVLGPRLNACGRMGHAREAARLLTLADATEARQLADFLTKENDRRRATERRIFDEARQLIEEAGHHAPERRAIVVAREDWHPGVVGIVASRLVDHFHRPAVVLAMDNGSAKGSARSVDGLSIHEAFTACSEHLDTFGGHAMAAGLSLQSERITSFRDALVGFVNDRLAPDDLVGVLTVDAAVPLAACELELFHEIQRLAPFGRANPKPRLLVRDVVLDQPPRFMGREGKHLALFLRQGDRVMRCPAFNMGHLAEQLPAGARLDVVFEPSVSTWQGRTSAELHIRDVKLR